MSDQTDKNMTGMEMPENIAAGDEAVRAAEGEVPIKPPLKVLEHMTVSRKFGWWAAVVLLESYAKRQVCLYLWQKTAEGWKRKQKFGIHSPEDWQAMKQAVDSYMGRIG